MRILTAIANFHRASMAFLIEKVNIALFPAASCDSSLIRYKGLYNYA